MKNKDRPYVTANDVRAAFRKMGWDYDAAVRRAFPEIKGSLDD